MEYISSVSGIKLIGISNNASPQQPFTHFLTLYLLLCFLCSMLWCKCFLYLLSCETMNHDHLCLSAQHILMKYKAFTFKKSWGKCGLMVGSLPRCLSFPEIIHEKVAHQILLLCFQFHVSVICSNTPHVPYLPFCFWLCIYISTCDSNLICASCAIIHYIYIFLFLVVHVLCVNQ